MGSLPTREFKNGQSVNCCCLRHGFACVFEWAVPTRKTPLSLDTPLRPLLLPSALFTTSSHLTSQGLSERERERAEGGGQQHMAKVRSSIPSRLEPLQGRQMTSLPNPSPRSGPFHSSSGQLQVLTLNIFQVMPPPLLKNQSYYDESVCDLWNAMRLSPSRNLYV